MPGKPPKVKRVEVNRAVSRRAEPLTAKDRLLIRRLLRKRL